jgi:4-hydroxybenzoate polyprenyltransferase
MVRRLKDDPYLRDPNIRKAANFQLLAWPALLAALGAAASGWFDFEPAIGVIGGIVIGFLIATTIMSLYGGRSTR